MPRPPTERGAPTAESASLQTAADESRKARDTTTQRTVESLPPLALAYGATWLAAERGIAAPCDDELLELTGYSSHSSPNKIFRQLQRRGLVVARGFQRGRQVEVIAIGKSTAPPQCQVSHWRHRARGNGRG